MADPILYGGTAVLTVAWSVWLYSAIAGGDDPGSKSLLVITPSAFFVVLAFVGWQSPESLRLDRFGLIALDVVTLMAALWLAASRRRHDSRRYRPVVWTYHLAALLVTAGAVIVASSPPVVELIEQAAARALAVRLPGPLARLLAGDGGSSPGASFAQKVGLAALTALPIAGVRFIARRRQMQTIRSEVAALRARVRELEQEEAPEV